VGPQQKSGDFDGDAGAETARAVRVDIPRVENAFDQTQIRVSDSCDGQALDSPVSGVQDNLALMRLKQADGRAGDEVFFDLRSGAAGRVGEARLVAWRSSAGFPCRVPRDLFLYETERPTRVPKGGNGDVASFLISIRERTKRYRGLEVALDERFLRPGDANCCGSIKKVTYWRYSRARDAYVRYASKLRRLRFRR
jgi:hypothetical protein